MSTKQIPALVDTDAAEHDLAGKFRRAFRDALNDDVLSEDEFWDAVADGE